jgi:hypothetical protein
MELVAIRFGQLLTLLIELGVGWILNGLISAVI